jgi:hypothetical protein
MHLRRQAWYGQLEGDEEKGIEKAGRDEECEGAKSVMKAAGSRTVQQRSALR